ncbi:hypothetical protein GCK32_015706, partial [Trichostrongylus colubriformis]
RSFHITNQNMRSLTPYGFSRNNQCLRLIRT